MKRILILDDEPSITFGLSRCLQSDQVDVISCNDLAAAKTAIMNNDKIDAVITDVRLSPLNSKDSMDFIQFVRSQFNDVALIMMSGADDVKNEVMQSGVNYFFHKPLDVDALIHLLRDHGLEVGRR